MTDNNNAANRHDRAALRIPLAVIIDSGARDSGDSVAGKNYRSVPPSAAADERFALHFMEGDARSVAAAVAAHPRWCGVLLTESARRSLAPFAAADGGADTGWAAGLNIDDSLLPVERVGRLWDDQANESFVARAFTCHAWRELQRDGLGIAALQRFYAQHKYLLMSRHIGSYQQVGKLLGGAADAEGGDPAAALQTLAHRTIALIMAGLRRPATRGGHANALAHIRGYLKGRLGAAENVALDESLEWYRLGLVPLTTPLALLRDYFQRYPDAYIDQQVYMQPALHARFDPAGLVGDGRAGALGAR